MSRIDASNLPPLGQWEPDDKGFIIIRRALLDPQHPLHPMFRGEKACAGYAWIDLVGMARWQDGTELLRGQLAASVSYLEPRWNRSESWIRGILGEFRDAGMILRRAQGGHRPSIISVRNYDYYNGDTRG